MNIDYDKLHKIITHIYNLVESASVIGSDTCAVFDVDRTLIDDKFQPIFLVVELYKYILSKGIKTFIVTARFDDGKELKEILCKHLYEAGVKDYTTLYMMREMDKDVTLYKKECRKDIKKSGYNILFSIGDNPCDIGEYGGLGFMIPFIYTF